jgi:hypothetical protein
MAKLKLVDGESRQKTDIRPSDHAGVDKLPVCFALLSTSMTGGASRRAVQELENGRRREKRTCIRRWRGARGSAQAQPGAIDE